MTTTSVLDLSSGYGQSEGRLLLSLRYIKYVCCWLLIWQDNMVDGSWLQLYEYTGRFASVRPIEIILLFTFIAFFVERTVRNDWTLKRSYFSAPILLMLLALFISWCRGVYFTQQWGVVFEIHESFLLPFIFFIVVNMMRDVEDRRNLLYIVILGTIPKGFEGVMIKYFSDDPIAGWGVLQMWRDGFLLALGVISTLLMLHYKGTDLRWLRKWLLWTSPFLLFTLIFSYRRTFFVAILVSAFLMMITIGRGRRLKHAGLLLLMLFAFAVFILLTDPIGFLARLAGVIQPGEEGSAAIRLMELPNVLMNIYHNPIWGTPIGTLWTEYFRMPTYANYTRVGVHNTYLYWPLRAGLLGTIGFVWLLVRMWKSALINFRLAKTEEDFFIGQISIHMIVIYQVACFFGLMYGDAVTTLLSVILTAFQLQMRGLSDLTSYKNVSLWQTWKKGEIVLKRPPEILPAKA